MTPRVTCTLTSVFSFWEGMDIIKDCIDNIALSGLEGALFLPNICILIHTLCAGCTVQELWVHLSISSPSFTLDPASKCYIWRQLLHFMHGEPGTSLALYRVPPDSRPSVEASEEYVHPYLYCFVNQNGVRGSCASFADRVDVTTTILEEQLQLGQVEERWGWVGWIWGWGVGG